MNYEYAFWLAPFGWTIFTLSFLVAIIMFAVKRKFYPVMYMLSIAIYIFTTGFAIDALDLQKNGVMIILTLSAIIFIALGVYFSYKFKRSKEQFMQRVPSRR
jgi:hypothetical protein